MDAQENVKKFMKNSIRNISGISSDEITKQYEKMREEIEKYVEEKVTVDVKWLDSIGFVED